MSTSGRSDASIQAFFTPTPNVSPTKSLSRSPQKLNYSVGDGFTAEEVKEALKPKPIEPWHPPVEYLECDIADLQPGPRAVTFMGRVANLFDVAHTPKAPRSAKGCLKLYVKDDSGAITVRFWYASHVPALRLGCLVSIWTNHISNGEKGMLSSASAPLFTSLFPERDGSCHLMVHENSDDGSMCNTPLDYQEGRPLGGVMPLQNFIDDGCDVVDAKILLIVKSVGVKKKVTRKDGISVVDNVNVKVEDNTAEATLGLWGTSASSPFATSHEDVDTTSVRRQAWRAGETVLLLQAPGWKIGSSTYLSITNATIIDVDPAIPDALWLRRWALRRKSKEAVNPRFPENVFDLQDIKTGPIRCLYTLAELDEFARAAPTDTFQGYLSLLIMEVKLLDYWKRKTLLCGECCNMVVYANALTTTCKNCEKTVTLRLSPRILGQVVDETAAISSGKLLFSDEAWRDLLGRGAEDLLKMGYEEIKHLSDRLLFTRVTMLFGWTGDDSKAGGGICVLGICA